MNKKEQAEVAELKKQLALAKAFRWPNEPEPECVDVRAILNARRAEDPSSEGRLYVGWAWHAHGLEFRITKGCSNGVSHSTENTTKTSSQWPGRFYDTREKAVLAARWHICRQFAAVLVRLDEESAHVEA